MNYLFCTKLSRKSENHKDSENSKFFLENKDASDKKDFKIEHRSDKDYPKGSFSQKVKKGFANSELLLQPLYAVKVFKSDLFKDEKHEFRLAMRGACCARFLGGTGFAFNHNYKNYLVTDWCAGVLLIDVEPAFIMNIPIADRIKLALGLIYKLSLLHKEGLIYCDIKADNVVISRTSLELIDFDSIRIKGELIKVGIAHTAGYIDAQLNWDAKYNKSEFHKGFDEKSDLYALGLTLGFLFPENFEPIYEKNIAIIRNLHNRNEIFEYNCVKLNKLKGHELHKELVDLVNDLTMNDKSVRLGSATELFDRLDAIRCGIYGGDEYIKPASSERMEICEPMQKIFSDIERDLDEYNGEQNEWKRKKMRVE